MKFVIITLTIGLVSAQYGVPPNSGIAQYRPQGGPPPQYRTQSVPPQYRTQSAPPQYRAAARPAPQQYQPQPQAAPSYSFTTTPKPVYFPPAKVHYVDIGQKLAGDYKFGYDTGKGPKGQSFREEVRLADGTIKGAYGYLDANGKMRIVKYTAGKNGYVVEGDEASNQAAARAGGARPAPQPQPSYSPPPQARPSYTPPAAPYRPPATPQYRPAAVPQYRPPQQYGGQQANAAPQQTGNPYGLPGVNLISVPPQGPQPRYPVGTKEEEKEYYGPALINAALLSYNIGTRH